MAEACGVDREEKAALIKKRLAYSIKTAFAGPTMNIRGFERQFNESYNQSQYLQQDKNELREGDSPVDVNKITEVEEQTHQTKTTSP